MPFQHAILDDTHLTYLQVGDGSTTWVTVPVDTRKFAHMGDLIDLTVQHACHQLWVLPGSQLSASFKTRDDSFVTGALETHDVFPIELAPFHKGWKKTGTHEERRAIEIAFPEYMDKGQFPMGLLTSPQDLYTALAYLEGTIGVPVKYSAERMGIELLRTLNDTPERKPFIRPYKSDLTPFYEHKAGDITWSRPLTPEEKRMKYLHYYDRNAMSLSACSSLPVGAGEYIYEQKPLFNKRVPGLYHIRLYGTSKFDGVNLPHPTKGATDTWVSTPLVQAAEECGYKVEVLEAYIFPEYHTTFTPWYKVLRDARASLTVGLARYCNEDARKAALDSVKMMYKKATGLLGEEPQEGEKTRWYNRPDWRSMIYGEANRRMFLTLLKLESDAMHLVGVFVDSLFLVSNNPNPQEAFPALPIGHQAGKYRYETTFPLSVVAHLVTDNTYALLIGLAQYRSERNEEIDHT